MGYRDVLNTIHESHDYIPVRLSYILQLHRDLLQYAQESFGGPFADSLASLSECDPVPFIKYLLGIILSCYRDFEERVDMMGKRSTQHILCEFSQTRLKNLLLLMEYLVFNPPLPR